MCNSLLLLSTLPYQGAQTTQSESTNNKTRWYKSAPPRLGLTEPRLATTALPLLSAPPMGMSIWLHLWLFHSIIVQFFRSIQSECFYLCIYVAWLVPPKCVCTFEEGFYFHPYVMPVGLPRNRRNRLRPSGAGHVIVSGYYVWAVPCKISKKKFNLCPIVFWSDLN